MVFFNIISEALYLWNGLTWYYRVLCIIMESTENIMMFFNIRKECSHSGAKEKC